MQLTIPVEGGVLAADDSGGGGPPLVLVHAGWADRSSWAGVASRLAGRYRIISYDARGYGASPPPQQPYTQLGDLVTVLDHVGVTRAAVAGHSGGGTAIGLALASPERVAALVLLAPGVQDYPWPAGDPYNAEFMALATAGDRAGLAELGLRTWAAAGPADATARAQVEGAVVAMFAQAEFEQPDPPAYGRLAGVTAPAVVVVGDLEYPMVARCADSIAERIPGCRRVAAPGADHLIPLRAPGLVADVITGQAG